MGQPLPPIPTNINQNIVYQNNNCLQVYTYDLYNKSVDDGMADTHMNEEWAKVNALVLETQADWKFKVTYDAGSHSSGPNAKQPRIRHYVVN